ncbi:hypothetical protein [Streptomyces coeruleorubidus]
MVLVTIALGMVTRAMAVRLGARTGKGLDTLIRRAVQPSPDRARRLLPAAGQHRARRQRVRRHRRGLSNFSASRGGQSSRRPRSCCGRWCCSAPTAGPSASS